MSVSLQVTRRYRVVAWCATGTEWDRGAGLWARSACAAVALVTTSLAYACASPLVLIACKLRDHSGELRVNSEERVPAAPNACAPRRCSRHVARHR